MSAPDWTKDEQTIEAAKSYLREGGAVDFFEMIARCILEQHPENLVEFSLKIVSDILSGVEIPPGVDFEPRKVEDDQFMREKSVSSFLDEWVLALLRERPCSDLDRMQFHKRYLEGLRSGSSAA